MTARWRPSAGQRTRAIGGAILCLTCGVAAETTASPSAPPGSGDGVANAIAEASRRFGVPEDWIRAVIKAESAFDSRATSRVGAMGLMQVMPATYAELRVRYGLGPDAYDSRDNVLAGTAYLRELHDRFGVRGALAAYNAGPGRYQEHLDTGRILPLETRIYVARIAAGGRLGERLADPNARVIAPRPTPPDPATAPLFVTLGSSSSGVRASANDARSELFPTPRLSEAGDE